MFLGVVSDLRISARGEFYNDFMQLHAFIDNSDNHSIINVGSVACPGEVSTANKLLAIKDPSYN